VTQAREGLGKTTRVDSLRVELLRGQALARLEAGQERLTSAQRDFAELLGFPPDRVFELTPAPALELQVPGSEEAVKIALENRLDYAQAIQDYDDAVRGAILAGRRLTPDMRVTVSYDDFPSTATAFGSVPTGSPLWFVGISSPTDFNITKERVALDQAKVTQTSTSQAIDLIKLSIARQVQQQLEVYRKARAALTIADQNLVIATRRAKLAKSLFEFGRGDNFSVTDAEVAFLQAESQLFSARADTSITAYQLSRVLGKIVDVADDLKPGPEVPSR
jgi:outer membrane protein TolC